MTKKRRQPCVVTMRGIVLAHSVRPLLNLILIYLCKNMSLVYSPQLQAKFAYMKYVYMYTIFTHARER